jgi:hypothetical protein
MTATDLLIHGPDVGFPLSVEEEMPMTMQLGMVGTDGIVLASDTRWTQQGGVRHSYDAPKIMINRPRGLAVSCARNMETSTQIADLILAGSNDTPAPDCLDIHRIASTVAKEAGDRWDAQCLIVSLQPRLRLLRLQTRKPAKEQIPPIMCQEVSNKAVIGDDNNPSVFWSEGYYEQRPMLSLVLLAAHLVITARKFNSGMISGLEIVLCDTNGIRRLDPNAIGQLELESKRISERLQSSFATYSQQFTYAPHMIR